MIVCGLCGTSIPDLGSRCSKCSGKAIERSNPIKALLSSPQKRGSPDRWAEKYTTPKSPCAISASPLSRTQRNPVSIQTPAPSTRPGFGRTETFDLALTAASDAELARVYGSLLDRGVQHPQCKKCSTNIVSGMKIYLARNDTQSLITGDTLCKSCYTETFAIGVCHRCTAPIIGDREEGLGGRHITARNLKWHGKCFNCSICGKSPSRQFTPLLLPDAAPACEDCYEHWLSVSSQGPSRETPSPNPAISSNKYPRPGQVTSQLPSQPSATAKEIKRLLQMNASSASSDDAAAATLSAIAYKDPSFDNHRLHRPATPPTKVPRLQIRPEAPERPPVNKQSSVALPTSVSDRIRQLNAQAGHQMSKTQPHDESNQPVNSLIDRRPLQALKKDNR